MRVIGYIAIVSTLLFVAAVPASGTSDKQGSSAPRVQIPLSLERNVGQFADKTIEWVGHGDGYNLSLGSQGAMIAPSASGRSDIVRVEFLNARPHAASEPFNPLPGRSSYLIGNDPKRWIHGLPTWGRIQYHNVYDGIDVAWYGNQGQLEYDFLIQPGADPNGIGMRFEGAQKLALDAHGDIQIATAAGSMKLRLPEVYQETGGARKRVRGHYVLRGSNEVAFALESYDRSRPLVIDPTLVYGTYFGGSGLGASAVATDSNGNVYIGGSGSAGLPLAGTPVQPGMAGNADAWVAKFDPTGTTLLYSTWVGGSNWEQVYGLAVDSTNEIVAAGSTESPDFPMVNAAWSTFSGPPLSQNAFVFKLTANGSGLVYSTYLSPVLGAAVAVDTSGAAYVAGDAESNAVATNGAYQTVYAGGMNDAFAAKLSPTGTLVYLTFIGGSGYDMSNAIAIDGSGNAYVAGYSDSTSIGTGLPGAQTTNAGGYDAFVAKVSSDGASVPWLTFFGGSGNETVSALARDSASGILYLAGSTTSTDLPKTAGTVQPASNGVQQGYVASISADGKSFGFATYLGGSRQDSINALALTPTGQIAVGGTTTSSGFPVVNAIQPTFQGTVTSLYASTDGGKTWTPSDSGLPVSVGALSVDPSNPGTILASSGGGYYSWFKTTNNGASWMPSGQTDVSDWWHMGGGQFARSWSNPAIVYFSFPESVGPGTGTSDSSWIAFGSSDGGNTWQELGVPAAASGDPLWGIAVSPADGNTVLEVTLSGAVFRSTDGGGSFIQVSTLPSPMNWFSAQSLTVSPDGSVYAATEQNVYKSTDFGSSWTSGSAGGLGDWQGMGLVAVSASNPVVVYAGSTWENQLFKTTDAGTTWTQVTAPGVGLYGSVLVVAPSDPKTVYIASGNQGAVSTDGGNTWNSGTLPGDVSAIAVSPSSPTTLWIGTSSSASDGFIAKLSENGKTLLWSTFYTGSNGASVNALTPAGSGGDVWVTGNTSSTDLPITANAYSSSPFGGSAFLARISDSTPACNLSINPQSITVYGGQTVGFGVTDTNGCNWTASPSDASWITVQSPSGGNGTGSGVVSAKLAANATGSTRTGSVNVNGSGDGSVAFNITQAASSCTYSLSPIGPLPEGGGDVVFSVTAPAGCPWTIVPQNPLITVVSGGSGVGNGTVTLLLPANPGVAWLDASVQVGPQTVQISQADACSFSLLPTSLDAGAASGSMTVTVSPAGCYWSPWSDSGWLSVSGGGTGSGTFSYQVSTNNGLGPRTANITLDNRQFQVTQANVGVWTLGEQQLPLVDSSGNGNYTWTLASGTLPPGLSLRTDVPSFFPAGVTTGLIGVATTPGNYSFTLSATNGATTQIPFTMKITGLALKDQVQLPDAFVGSPYSYQLTALNPAAGGTVTWTPANDNSMPAGLSLSSTGLLSGSPTASPGYHNINFSFTDGTDTVNSSVTLYISLVQITSPGLLPNATQYASYSYTLTASGGTGPYTFNGCCLPNGLNLDSTGSITGTVNSGEGKQGFWVTVTDSQNNTASKLMVIDVVGMPENMAQLSPSGGQWDDCTIGWGCSRGINANAGGAAPLTWTVTGLPPGMDFRSGSGVTRWDYTPGDLEIWGTPTSVGLYQLTVTVTDANGLSTTEVFPLNVSALLEDTSLPNGTVGVAYSAAPRIVGGVLPYTAAVLPSTSNTDRLPAGLLLSALTVGGIPLEGGGFNPRFQFGDSTGTPYTLTQTQNFYMNGVTGTSTNVYTQSTLYATLNQPWQWQLGACCAASYTWTQIGGTLPHNITLSSGGQLSGTPDTIGTYTFLVQATNTGNPSDFGTRQVIIVVTPIFGFGGSLPYGNVGAPYSQQLSVTGGVGPYTWTPMPGSFLPPGLSVSGSGLLNGTPTATGAYNFCLTVADYVSRSIWGCYSLNIYPTGGTPPVGIAMGPSFGTLSVGPFWSPLTANGGSGTYTWSVVAGSLPPGLMVRTDFPAGWWGPNQQAALAGVATTPGNYSFTLQVSSGGQTAQQPFTLRITALALKDQVQLPDAFVGSAYSYQLTALNPAAGGTVTWTPTNDGSMPPGMSLSSTGLLSGTPTAAGNDRINFSFTDGTDTVNTSVALNISLVQITSPGQLPNATQYASYSYTLQASGGTGPYTFNGCCLPNGLNLASNGAITGTVNSGEGKQGFWVTVTDSQSNSYNKQMAIDVVGAPESMAQLSPSGGQWDDCTIGWGCSRGINANAGGAAPLTWTVTGLPPGMDYRSGSGVTQANYTPGDLEIWGTPTAVGSYQVQATVTDTNGLSTSEVFPLNISALAEVTGLPNGTVGVLYSATPWVIGGVPSYAGVEIPSTNSPGTLPAGLSLSGSTVSGTPLEGGGFNPRFLFTDSAGTPNTLTQTQNFYINGVAGTSTNVNNYSTFYATLNQPWQVQLWACCAASYTWAQVSGTLPDGITLSSGGLLSGTPDIPGTYTFLVQATNAGNPSDYGTRQIVIVVTPVQGFGGMLPYGNVGTGYSQQLSTTGGVAPYTWTLQAGSFLPPGLTLSASGLLSGTPTATGAYGFCVTVATQYNIYSNYGCYNLNIYGAGGGPPVSFGLSPDFGTTHWGTITYGLPANGGNGTYTWALVSGSLPPGVALRTDVPSYFNSNWQAGLMGVATKPGTYNFTLSVSSAGQTISQPFTMRITALDLQDAALPDAFVNTPFSYPFTPIGNAGTVTFTVNQNSTNGAMPPGLTLSGNGVLSGTPSASGNYEIAMNISDGVDTMYEQYNLYISAINITTPAQLPNGTQNAAYSTSLSASGGTGTYTWTLSGGLPNGLTLSADGTISGTITNGPGPFGFTVTATDGNSAAYSKNMMIDTIASPGGAMQINGGQLNDATIGDHYQVGVNVCCGGTAPYTWTVTGLPSGLTYGQVGNSVPGNVQVYGVPQQTGTFNTQFAVTDANGASTTYVFPIHVSVLNAMTIEGDWWNMPNGTIGTPYYEKLLVLGGTGPYGFNYNGLGNFPQALFTNYSALTVTGTPFENGDFHAGFVFSDSAADTLFRFRNFHINGANSSTITINCNGYNCNNLGTVLVGNPYWTQFWASGVASCLWSVLPTPGQLPPGLSMAADGELSGTVTTPGVYVFLVAATDASNPNNVGVKAFILTVTPMTITTQSLPDATVGSVYSVPMTASGGTGALTWTLVASGNWQLPPGLTLSPKGTISGIPTSPGSYNFMLTATDTSGNFVTAGYWLTVHPATGPVVPALRFVPIPPCRVVDTRNASGPLGGPTIAGGTERDFILPNGTCGIPSTAQAYSLNAAMIPKAKGWITIWPTGQTQPGTASVNSPDGRVKSSSVMIQAGRGGAISVSASPTTVSTNVALDINGYFVPAATNPTALQFYPLTPCRVADTRNATGTLGGPYMTGGSIRVFPVFSATSCNIPSAAQAFSFNITVIPRGSKMRWLTAWPSNVTQPVVASLDDPPGVTLSNGLIVPAPTDNSGDVSIYVTDDTHVAIDINGYFAPPGTGGLSLYTLPPCRALDTRNPKGSLPFTGDLDVDVVDSGCGVPMTAQDYIFNATIIPESPHGYLTMWAEGQSKPLAANVTVSDGTNTGNMALVPAGSGWLCTYYSYSTYLVLDLFGYFAP